MATATKEKFVLTKEAKDLLALFIGAGAAKGPVRTSTFKGRITPEVYTELRKYGEAIVKVEGRGPGATLRVMCKPEDISDETAPSREIRRRPRAGNAALAVRTPVRAPDPGTSVKFVKYLNQKEKWMTETRATIKNQNATLANAVDKLGFDAVARYVHQVEAITGGDAWRKHLEDRFGADAVRYFEPYLAGTNGDD